jgi:outer membrane lipoprotein-sorting protein
MQPALKPALHETLIVLRKLIAIMPDFQISSEVFIVRKWLAVQFAVSMIGSLIAIAQSTKPAQPPKAQVEQTSQPASENGKTAEQQFKNIKLLKGAPADQLVPAMQYFNAALGVQCNFCHVNQPQWAPEKDDKEEKRTAREMISMTEAINKSNFEGKPEVGCSTCHSGHSHPMAVPPLFDEHNPNAREANMHGGPRPQLPTVAQVLEAYQKAIGGADAIQKLTTKSAKATVTSFQGQTSHIEVVQKTPNLTSTIMTLPNGQTRLQIYDGKSGWNKGDRGVNEVTGPDLAALRTVSRFDREFAPTADLVNARVTNIETIDGHECYVVRGQHTDKDFSERLYFDKESGLLLRRVSAQRTLFGPLADSSDYKDYKDVQGVKMAFTVKRTTPETTFTRKIDSLEFNKPVGDDAFYKPEAAQQAPPAK